MTMGRRKKFNESPRMDSPQRGYQLSRSKRSFFGKSAENRKKDNYDVGTVVGGGKSDKRGIFGRGRKASHQSPEQDVQIDGTQQHVSYNSTIRDNSGTHHTSTLSVESPEESTPFEMSEITTKKKSSRKLQEHKSMASATKMADSLSRKTGKSSKKSSGRTPNFEESLVFSELSESDVEESIRRKHVQRSASPPKRSTSVPRRELAKKANHHKQIRKIIAKERYHDHGRHRRHRSSKHKRRQSREHDEHLPSFMQRFLGVLDATCLAPEENDISAHLSCLGPIKKKKKKDKSRARQKDSLFPEWGLAPYFEDSDDETTHENNAFSMERLSRDLLTIHGGSECRANNNKKITHKNHRRSVHRHKDLKHSTKKSGKVSRYQNSGKYDDDQSYDTNNYSRQSSRSWDDYDGTESSSSAESRGFVDVAICGRDF